MRQVGFKPSGLIVNRLAHRWGYYYSKRCKYKADEPSAAKPRPKGFNQKSLTAENAKSAEVESRKQGQEAINRGIR
jgi:hypothetical protein